MLVGVIGSGQIGRDPFDRRAWSGSSHYFFTEIRRRRALHRAFGVEAPGWQRAMIMARYFHPNRSFWRRRFYLDIGYRHILTRRIAAELTPEDLAHDFIQIGAYYDVPSILAGRGRSFGYHDGNLACSMQNPFSVGGLPARMVDRAFAYERQVAEGTRIIFTMSEFLRQSFIADYGIPPERVVAIGAGLNLDSIPAPATDKSYATKEILFVGVDFERKGGPGLLKAFARVRERHPTAMLHIVGPVGLDLPAHLSNGVVLHGFVSKASPEGRKTLDELFARSCLFVMPSLYEPFGIAPLEAMAYELPAVLTNDWALKEMVEPGVTGFLVERGDADDLGDKLLEALADSERLARMGRAARRAVIGRFTWPAVIDRLLSAIDADGASKVNK